MIYLSHMRITPKFLNFLKGTSRIALIELILTLTLQTCAEEKRVRVRLMWPSAGSGRSKRT